MDHPSQPPATKVPYDLNRFVVAQHGTYASALAEIRAGEKRSHWMWFVFPQLRGLGASAMSARYAISGLAGAKAYLEHPVLGPRLIESCEAVLASDVSAHAMFGWPDDRKLKSCATLFAATEPGLPVFSQLIVRKFGGASDPRTLQWLASAPRAQRALV